MVGALFWTEIADATGRLLLRCGLPEAYLAASDAESLKLRKDSIRTYLERDVPMVAPRVPASSLQRLWTMLAHGQGTVLKASQLVRSLEVSPQSVTRYVDLLCDVLLVRRLPPLQANVGKRLVKLPKVFVRDGGLVHALLGLETVTKRLGHPVVGRSWEGFVIETLLAAAAWPAHASFYRTSSGAEVDLVIDHADGRRWLVEVKRSLSTGVRRRFRHAIEDLRAERGFVVHAGEDRYPLGSRLEAIGLRELAAGLASEAR